ncbi:hypothetical protein ACIQ57_12365 [Lysinibacillus xylanilyticus]|uniref:hypothetical protein n=1 Tax=Lysinibacillus xylanilyticus TaxID=582475 RepID=UPI00381F2F9A
MRKRSANVASATKRPAGTEINPLFCRRTTLYLIAQSIKTRKAFGRIPNAFYHAI